MIFNSFITVHVSKKGDVLSEPRFVQMFLSYP